jgi:regulator of protease activity HflC (stomatin/prohibitin superfamily)
MAKAFEKNNLVIFGTAAILILLGLIFALVVLSSTGYGLWVVVGAGSVGVQDTFGYVNPSVLGSGLHFKAPWTKVVPINAKTQSLDLVGTSDARALTSEGLTVEMSATALYHVEPVQASDVYRTIGTDYEQIMIVPIVRGALREEVAKYRAEDIYSQERGGIAAAVKTNVNAKLNPRGIYVDDFIIRNVILPEQLSQAIQSKQAAEQQIQQKKFEVDREKAEADRKRAEAQGIADSNRIIAESLTDSYLRWYWIEKVAASGSTIYVPSDMSLVKTI